MSLDLTHGSNLHIAEGNSGEVARFQPGFPLNQVKQNAQTIDPVAISLKKSIHQEKLNHRIKEIKQFDENVKHSHVSFVIAAIKAPGDCMQICRTTFDRKSMAKNAE